MFPNFSQLSVGAKRFSTSGSDTTTKRAKKEDLPRESYARLLDRVSKMASTNLHPEALELDPTESEQLFENIAGCLKVPDGESKITKSIEFLRIVSDMLLEHDVWFMDQPDVSKGISLAYGNGPSRATAICEKVIAGATAEDIVTGSEVFYFAADLLSELKKRAEVLVEPIRLDVQIAHLKQGATLRAGMASVHSDACAKRSKRGRVYHGIRYFSEDGSEEGFGAPFLFSMCYDENHKIASCGTRLYANVPRVNTKRAVEYIEKHFDRSNYADDAETIDLLETTAEKISFSTTNVIEEIAGRMHYENWLRSSEPDLFGIRVIEVDCGTWSSKAAYSFHRSPLASELPTTGARFLSLVYPYGHTDISFLRDDRNLRRVDVFGVVFDIRVELVDPCEPL